MERVHTDGGDKHERLMDLLGCRARVECPLGERACTFDVERGHRRPHRNADEGGRPKVEGLSRRGVPQQRQRLVA
jgi:hypothetical protein